MTHDLVLKRATCVAPSGTVLADVGSFDGMRGRVGRTIGRGTSWMTGESLRKAGSEPVAFQEVL